MLPLIIGALVFLTVFLLVAYLLRPQAAVAQKRMNDYLLTAPSEVRRDVPTFAVRVLIPALKALGGVIGAITPAQTWQRYREKLDMAGNPSNYGVIEYLGTRVLSIGVVIPLGFWGLHVLQLSLLLTWLIGAMIVAVGIWLPDMVLQRVIEARQSAIRRALPDVLDLLVISVEAGVGFDGAVQKVVEKIKGPLNVEFARVLEQVRLGKSRAEALREMGQRTQVSDLASFVAAIMQAETLGISIAKVLRTQADTARQRRAQRAREMGAKLPVKLLFPLVFFIFPSLFVVILAPGIIRFAELFKALSGGH